LRERKKRITSKTTTTPPTLQQELPSPNPEVAGQNPDKKRSSVLMALPSSKLEVA
jgi:hypothetical protein